MPENNDPDLPEGEPASQHSAAHAEGAATADAPAPAEPLHAAPAAAAGMAWSKRWKLWLAGAVLLLATGAAGLWVGKLVATERTFRGVERAALVSDVAPPAVAETPAEASPPAADMPPATPIVPAAAMGAAAGAAAVVASRAPEALDVKGGSGGAGTVGAGVQREPEPQPEPQARTADQVEKKVVKRKARKAKASTAAKMRRARDGTFKRCPPLGQKGAVMCRWHICNGAAGKEAACRPYLERKP